MSGSQLPEWEGSEFTDAPTAPGAQDDFTAFEEAPANGTADVIQTQAAPIFEDDQAGAFLGDYTPAPIVQPPAAAGGGQQDDNDPRLVWTRKHADVLKQKDAEEKAAKQAAAAKGKEHLAKFYEARKTQFAARKGTNRKGATGSSEEATVPTTGTAWEKITAVINFSASGHQKDVSRYKEVLLMCKAQNVAVR